MTKEKRNIILRTLIPLLVLLAIGVGFFLLGHKLDSGEPTTFELLASLVCGALTLLTGVVFGLIHKKGFLYALLLYVICAFPLLPTSRLFFSPLYALVDALAAGVWIPYILFCGALLLLFGIATGLRILLSRYWNNDSIPFIPTSGRFQR